MMPAIRAAASTSPLGAYAPATASKASLERTMIASATASRTVAFLADTSAMRAAPCSSRCVSLVMERVYCVPSKRYSPSAHKRRRSGKQCFCCGHEVGSAHQAFTDEERGDAGLREAAQIVACRKPAFGND